MGGRSERIVSRPFEAQSPGCERSFPARVIKSRTGSHAPTQEHPGILGA
jgi:hypothetical protein